MRNARRFEFESPITVGVRDLSNGHGLEVGQLRDISTRGARFALQHPLRVNTEAVLLVHFSDPSNRSTTIRFEGTVTRVENDSPYEIALRFHKRTKIFPGGLVDFLEHQGKTLARRSAKGILQPSRSKRGEIRLADFRSVFN